MIKEIVALSLMVFVLFIGIPSFANELDDECINVCTGDGFTGGKYGTDSCKVENVRNECCCSK